MLAGVNGVRQSVKEKFLQPRPRHEFVCLRLELTSRTATCILTDLPDLHLLEDKKCSWLFAHAYHEQSTPEAVSSRA